MTMADIFLEQGFEGAMLRKIDYPTYEPRRLVGQMLKYKPTEIDEYLIIGVEEAISLAQEPLGMVGSFLVQGDDGMEFKVGAGKLKHKERREYWERKETLLGKTLVTKQGKILTTEGIPTCMVAVEIKEE
jgi:ATP-dependent DNA ligase